MDLPRSELQLEIVALLRINIMLDIVLHYCQLKKGPTQFSPEIGTNC